MRSESGRLGRSASKAVPRREGGGQPRGPVAATEPREPHTRDFDARRPGHVPDAQRRGPLSHRSRERGDYPLRRPACSLADGFRRDAIWRESRARRSAGRGNGGFAPVLLEAFPGRKRGARRRRVRGGQRTEGPGADGARGPAGTAAERRRRKEGTGGRAAAAPGVLVRSRRIEERAAGDPDSSGEATFYVNGHWAEDHTSSREGGEGGGMNGNNT